MRSRSAVPACPALPREVLARHWVWPEELYETTDRGPGVGDRHMRLWLHLADRRVLALRFAALDAPDDRVIAPTVAALAGDLRGERQGLELPDVGYVHVLYAAPVAPPPAMNAATGRSEGPLRWAPGLDGEVLDALQSLRGRRFYLSVRNYNRLAPLPPELRARRLQALRRFPALVAPILLAAHAYPNCADGQRHARRHADPEVEAAIDRGRDLTGALARHYGISRALVRSALNAEFWDISYGMRRSILALLDVLPANKRPESALALVRELDGLHSYLLFIGKDEGSEPLPSRLVVEAHLRSFARGWEATWCKLRQRFWPLYRQLADANDFLAAAAEEAARLTCRRHGPPERHLAVAWIASHGLFGLLRDSARWHAWRPRQRRAMPDIDFTLPALVGEWHDGGFAARELLTAQALQEEGEAMHHCVGSYWERCVAGERIFALTDAQGQRATAQYQPVVLASARDEITYRLVQLRGPCNQEVGKKLSRFASQLAKVINAPERQDARRAALAAIDTLRRLQRDARHAPALPALDATSRARLLPVLARLSFEPAAPGTLLVAHVAGVDYHDFPRLEVQGLARFAAGDTLHLIREPDNPRDALAVRIDWQGHRLGYVPRPDNAEIARRLAAGEGLVCRITRFTPTAPNWRKIEVVITEDRA